MEKPIGYKMAELEPIREPVEADSAGSARTEPAESASTDSWGLTQKSPWWISRMDTYLPASENPIQKYWKP